MRAGHRVVERRREFLRQLRVNCAMGHEEVAPWLEEEILSGEWFRRQREISLAIRVSMARTARQRRDLRRQPVNNRSVQNSGQRTARPRERRPRRATARARSPGRLGDDDPSPLAGSPLPAWAWEADQRGTYGLWQTGAGP